MTFHWTFDNQINLELGMVDGIVIDAHRPEEGGNDALQQLSHIINRLPEQWAELTIEFHVDGIYVNDGTRNRPRYLLTMEDSEYSLTRAYLCPISELYDAPEIRVRPRIANALFDQYLDDIMEVEIHVDNNSSDGYESIQNLADAITEDPDVFDHQ